jgi:hypothetical protein
MLDKPRIPNPSNTIRLALASSFAALFVISTFFPLTPFIGGPSFITVEILLVPVIAAILRPVFATVTAFMGTLGMVAGGTSFYRVFGLPGILIPVIAVALGSVAFHYRLGALLPWGYVLAGSIYYLVFSQGGTLLWLGPYALVIISLPVLFRLEGIWRIGLLALYTAMCEQVTMNIFSISLLNLVGPVWSIITPFMYSERAVAAVGGTLLIVALKSRLGTRLELDASDWEVKNRRCV